jgi:Putative Actinobacterial Holin-X, holin superfamily III
MTDNNEATRRAMAGLSSLVRGVGRDVVTGVGRDVVTGVGRDVGQLLRRELESARAELMESGKRAGKGAGLLGGAAVAGELSLLYLSLAAWKGLGNRIGPGKAAFVLGTLAGGAGVALALRGRDELERIQGAPRTVRSLRELGTAVGDAAQEPPEREQSPEPGA